MSGSSVRHTPALDQHLKNEYHEICFNPARRDTLIRLTSPARQQGEGQLGNAMLRDYMDSIYDHYGIEDPIRRELRLAKRSLDLPAKPSPEKSLNQTQVSESDRLTRTKRRLINLKDSFKRDSSDVVYSSQLIAQEEGSPVNRSRLSRQIGYRTKEKIHFKTLPREEPLRHFSRPTVRHQFVIEGRGQPKVVVRFNNNPEYHHLAPEVPAVFRYCPICEAAVLECNIAHHENSCRGIQQAYRMPYAEIEALLLAKIRRLEGEIGRELLQRDEGRAGDELASLKQSVTLWMDGRPSHSLEKLRMQFHSYACDAYEKVNKLNWFRRLHKTVACKRSLALALLG